MTIDEQKQAERQIVLCDKRQKLIEAGALRSCQPIPAPMLPRPDDCPECGGKMHWLKSRQGWICFKPSCQPAMPKPIDTFHI